MIPSPIPSLAAQRKDGIDNRLAKRQFGPWRGGGQ